MIQRFNVSGMHCAHCERAIAQALRAVDPQATVHIDRAKHQVEVESEQPREALAHAIAEEGYSVT